MEDAWRVQPGEGGLLNSDSLGRDNAPWGLGWQASERNLVWNDELRMGLLKKVAAAELGLSSEEIEQRLRTVGQLLPDIQPRMAQMKAQLLVRLAAKVDHLAERLMELKVIFPNSNVSLMVSRAPALALMDDLEQIRKGAAAFHDLLPTADLDKIVEEHASVLDTKTLEEALQEAKRLLPGVDLANLLTRSPDMLLQFQKGSTMIPYDAVPGQD